MRTLKPLDTDCILNSVAKTGRIVIAEESHQTGSIAAEIAAVLLEKGYDTLDAPLARVCLPDEPIYFAPEKEQAQLPSASRIKKAVLDILAVSG